MKKILCIGDSLTLPRGEDVKYENTWFYLLKHYFQDIDFISFFKRGITTNILVQEGGGDKNTAEKYPFGADCLEHYKPNIIILQLGIVDCAPRLLKQGMETKLVNHLPKKIANIYIKLIKTTRKRNTANTYVSLKKFEDNLINYFERCKNQNIEKLIIIKIAIPSQEMVDKNPEIIKNVIKYNAVYDKLEKKYPFVNSINPLDSSKTNEIIFTDGYHPNAKGNTFVYSELKDFFE